MRVRLIAIAMITVFAAANVSAERLIRFNQDDNFSGGEIWGPITGADLTTPIDLSVFPNFEALYPDDLNNLPTGGPNSGFSVDYGNGPQNLVNILANGSITFGATNPSTNVAAPLLSGVDAAQITWAMGFIDPDFVFGDIASLDDFVNAFRVTWFVPSVDDSNNAANYAFQVVLIDRSKRAAGDFDMEFNYEDFSGALTPPGATGGFQLGANVPGFTWPLTKEGSLTFQFHNGVLEPTTPPTGVPEPNSIVLVLTGLSLIALGMYRRRAAIQPVR